jgi:hypothetical protein
LCLGIVGNPPFIRCQNLPEKRPFYGLAKELLFADAADGVTVLAG